MRKCLIALAALLAACGPVKRPDAELLFRLSDFPELEHIDNVQGCAIWDNWLFSLQNEGWCNVFDLIDCEPAGQFPLGSRGKHNHANVAFFGSERYDAADVFPLLYVSQCLSKTVEEIGLPQTDSLSRLLFVERILTDENGRPWGSELVQIIHYEPAEWNSRLWIADQDHPETVYCYGNTVGNGKPGNHIVLQKFALPSFSADQFLVSLGPDNVLESMNFDDLLPEGARGPQNNTLQGAFLKDGILFLPVGTGSERHPSEIFYAKLDGSRYGYFDYTDQVPCEMEDFGFWDGKLICPCNSYKQGQGAVYAIPYRTLRRAMVRNK